MRQEGKTFDQLTRCVAAMRAGQSVVFVAIQEGYDFRVTHAGTTTITLPDDMPDWTQLYFALKAAGEVVFTAPAGTSILQPAGFQTKMNVHGAMCMAKYVGRAHVFGIGNAVWSRSFMLEIQLYIVVLTVSIHISTWLTPKTM